MAKTTYFHFRGYKFNTWSFVALSVLPKQWRKVEEMCSPSLKECAPPHGSLRRRWWHPTPVLLPGKSHGRRSLVGCSPWGRLRVGHNWATSLSLFTFTLEKEMATHSSVLAWRIPGTGEPGGLPSMGSHSRTQLKWLSSSSMVPWHFSLCRAQLEHKELLWLNQNSFDVI